MSDKKILTWYDFFGFLLVIAAIVTFLIILRLNTDLRATAPAFVGVALFFGRRRKWRNKFVLHIPLEKEDKKDIKYFNFISIILIAISIYWSFMDNPYRKKITHTPYQNLQMLMYGNYGN